MLIFVPSHQRTSRPQIASGPLPRLTEHLHRTFLVVPYGQGLAYKAAVDRDQLLVQVLETPEGLTGIGPTRHWIGEEAQRRGAAKFCMMDDDIDFLIRRSPANWQLEAQTTEQTAEMLDAIELWLDTVAMVGVSSREGNNRFGLTDAEGKQVGHANCPSMCPRDTRIMRLFAVRTADWLEMEHHRVEVMEDFDLTLQLLRAGRGNVNLAYYANGQKQTNSPCGCSTYRTHEVQDRAARRLAELHAPFVRLRIKENKTDREGLGTRTEVTIAWKRAAAEGYARVKAE